MLLLSALIVAAAVVLSAWWISRAVAASARRDDRARDMLALFAPAVAAAADNPRALIVWQPLAETARQLYPDAFASLDRASAHRFPFSVETIEAAHAKWTADWLAWERSHDAESKLKAVAAQHELGAEASSAYGRARLDAIEREKLESYQRHYEDYTRVAKAIQALIPKK